MGNCLKCFKSTSTNERPIIPNTCCVQQQQQQNVHYNTQQLEQKQFHNQFQKDKQKNQQSEIKETELLYQFDNDIMERNSLNMNHIENEMNKTGLINSTVVNSASSSSNNKKKLSNTNKNLFDESQISDNTLNLLFEKYKDPQEDAILSEGIETLCRDLGHAPDEFAILIFAWNLNASEMCRFTKTEFIEGLHNMLADSVPTIRLRLQETIQKLKSDTELFKQLYRFTFKFGLEPDHRILSLDMAIILWRLVFTVYHPEILNNWLTFLETNALTYRGIPKDTWNMFLNFCEQCDINNYDDTEAWPSIFDDFVDYEKSKINNNIHDTTKIDGNRTS